MALSSVSYSPSLGPLALGFAALTALAVLGCAPEAAGPRETGQGRAEPVAFPSFEDFRASVYREPWPGGAYIVEGDIALFDDDALRAYYERRTFAPTALVLGTDNGGNDVMWNADARLQLTYCIDDTFADDERDFVAKSLRIAAARWEAIVDVDFRHAEDQDANCTSNNGQVIFNVTKVETNELYFARAFFPSDPREKRQINVDKAAFDPLRSSNVDDVMTHELGHALGFRHEHARNEAVRKDPELCSENPEGWRAFTPYDGRSVMAYPECGGFMAGQFIISPVDELGAVAVYGSPGRLQPTDAVSVTYRYDLPNISNAPFPFNKAFRARGGSTFVAIMKGRVATDQPNLFVNLGEEAVPNSSDCQPQIDNDAPETCRLAIPPGPDVNVYITVQADGAASVGNFGLTVVYVDTAAGR